MRTLSILALALLAVLVIVPAYAQTQAPVQAPVAPAVATKIVGIIDSVNVAESKIVVDEGEKKFTTLIVERTTAITLADGKIGTLDELVGKKGDKVEVQATSDGKAVSIKVLPAVPVPVPAPIK